MRFNTRVDHFFIKRLFVDLRLSWEQEDLERSEQLLNVISFIKGKCNVQLVRGQISQLGQEARENPHLRKFLDPNNLDCPIVPLEHERLPQGDEKANPILLEEKAFWDRIFLILKEKPNQKDRGYASQNGVLILDVEKFRSKWSVMIREKSKTFAQGQAASLDDILGEILLPSKAFVLIDPYLCSDYQVKRRYQLLVKILETISSRVGVAFHFHLITRIEDKSMSDSGAREIEAEVRKTVRQRFPAIKFCLTNIPRNNPINLHDRHLLSTYLNLEIPAGFDNFRKGKAHTQTTIRFTHIFANSETYTRNREWVCKAVEGGK
ncbi:MAG: hypothetical protein KDI06_08605 [Calditrichaeota bacterium]|nr:hypothetical protein [Calditrichota bacterium]HQU72030.1 hypothetical protein [Calditrichia bacterium]